MDSATYETEQLIAKMEYRLNKEYSQAEKEIEEKLNKHFERYKEKDERQRQKVERGQLSEKDYQEWRKSQLLAGKRWENQKAVISQDLYNVNRIATSIVNGYMPEVYAIGHNFATYQMETAAGIDTGYTLYNREAVEKILRENKALLPPPRDINKFKDGLWNRQMLQSVMIQGILQGESMTALAKRLAKKTGDSNKKSAMRNARTMSASALNGGRYDAAKRLKGMGVDVKLQWRATFDTRTRDSHRQMDGEVREVGEEFSNGLLFPVDMEKFSHGGLMKVSEFNHLCRETYNCRCAIRSLVKGLEPQAIKYRVGEVKGLSYEEWKKGRNKPRMVKKTLPIHKPHEKPIKALTRPIESKIEGLKSTIREFKNLTVEEYNKMVTMSLKSVKSADKKAIMGHKNPDGSNGGYVRTVNYRIINTSLRNGHLENLTQYDVETVDALRRAIKSYKLPQDTNLYRYVHADYGISQMLGVRGEYGDILEWDIKYKKAADVQKIVDKINEQVGKEVLEKGFVSTSVIKEKNVVSYDKAVRMVIKTPQGTNCFLPNNKIESECILGENTKLVFKGAKLLQEGNPKHNIVEMVLEVKENG